MTNPATANTYPSQRFSIAPMLDWMHF